MGHPSLQATKTTSGSVFVYIYMSTQSIQDEIVEYAIKVIILTNSRPSIKFSLCIDAPLPQREEGLLLTG